jgi:hypothetical protein
MNRSSGDFTSLVEERTFMESIISRYGTVQEYSML